MQQCIYSNQASQTKQSDSYHLIILKLLIRWLILGPILQSQCAAFLLIFARGEKHIFPKIQAQKLNKFLNKQTDNFTSL